MSYKQRQRNARTAATLSSVREFGSSGVEWAVVWNLQHIQSADLQLARMSLAEAEAIHSPGGYGHESGSRTGVVAVSTDAMAESLRMLLQLGQMNQPRNDATGGTAQPPSVDPDGLLPPAKDSMRAIIFSDLPPAILMEVLYPFRRRLLPIVGRVAHQDIVVQPGNSRLDPTRTAGLAACGIATKIMRGEIHVINSVKICSRGEIVNGTVAQVAHSLQLYQELPIAFDGAVHLPTGLWVTAADCCRDITGIPAHIRVDMFKARRDDARAAATMPDATNSTDGGDAAAALPPADFSDVACPPTPNEYEGRTRQWQRLNKYYYRESSMTLSVIGTRAAQHVEVDGGGDRRDEDGAGSTIAAGIWRLAMATAALHLQHDGSVTATLNTSSAGLLRVFVEATRAAEASRAAAAAAAAAAEATKFLPPPKRSSDDDDEFADLFA